MTIYGRSNIHKTLFKNLKKGEVFFLYKDYKDFTDWKVYMRCGYTDESSAVDLSTGICYNFDNDEHVEIVDASMIINQI